jgi:hypothetical protein
MNATLLNAAPELSQEAPALSGQDIEALRHAHRRLEYPGFAARITSRIGAPIQRFFKALPDTWRDRLQAALRASLERTLAAAIYSLGGDSPRRRGGLRLHRAMGAVSGAAGGLFGLPAVLAELPVTSGIILRSIADIAKSEGENLDDPEVRLACMEVFALGGRSASDDAADIGYYGIRLALGAHLTRISERVAAGGIVRLSPPGLVRFLAEIAARFGVAVTQKVALQMVPILGAGTGSLINLVFIEHFQEIARAHFTMRRLERAYGFDLAQAEYEKLSLREPTAAPA